MNSPSFSGYICAVLLLVCRVCQVCSENVLGVETQEFDFDGLPGATHEFKVYIPGQSEDCFFQPVAEGAQLWVSFEVMQTYTAQMSRTKSSNILDFFFFTIAGFMY